MRWAKGDRLIGRDNASTFPHEAQVPPDLGHLRARSPRWCGLSDQT
jgi:ABC-type hemin transport system substrate-binding protein